jgi:long-chain fatty acid transport protein
MIARWSCLLLVLAIAPDAGASGFAAARFGGEHGNPVTSNATALYYNPAGLALGSGTRIYLDGTFALRSVSYDRPREAISNIIPPGSPAGDHGTPDEPLGIAANSGKAELNNFIASPFAGIVSDLGVKNLGVGLGLYVPFGGQAVWDKVDRFKGTQYPGATGGVQRWSTIEGTIRSLYVTLGGAYRFEPLHLSVGVGANLISSEVNTIRARTIDGSDDLVFGDGSLYEGRSWLDVKNTSFSLGGGLLWEPADGLRIGASYQSQPGFGELKYDGTLYTALGTSPATNTPVDFTQSLPDVFRLGVSWRSDKVELRLFGDLTRWSVLTNQCILNKGGRCEVGADGSAAGNAGIVLNIPRNWKDAFGARAGGSYWVNPDLELFLGAGYDGNAVPDSTVDASLIDMPKYTASIGGGYDLGNLNIGLTLTQVIYQERTVKQADVKQYVSPSRNPSGAGTYDQSISLAVLSLGYRF